MIDDLSRTLQVILEQEGVPKELAEARIVFEHPSEKYSEEHQDRSTVDLFLYDIREDLELRSNEPIIERKDGEAITYQPPMRVACSYLVTAWPVGGTELALQEHKLLGQVLQVFSRYPKIPGSFLQGDLKGQAPPLPMITALVDPEKNLSEFWTALGSRLRPSLTITITFSMTLLPPETAVPVVSKDLRFSNDRKLESIATPEAEMFKPPKVEQFLELGVYGRVTDTRSAPVAGATVSLGELGLSARTNDQGRYALIVNRPGRYTLRVEKGNKVQETSTEVPTGVEKNLQLP